MSAPITLYTNPRSRGRIARWALEEAGARYDTVILEYGGSMKEPDYLAINPMGKVPAIRHGGQVVTEAAAICAYLAEAFPRSRTGADGGGARRLLPLAVLRRRTAGICDEHQGSGLDATRGQDSDDRLRHL